MNTRSHQPLPLKLSRLLAELRWGCFAAVGLYLFLAFVSYNKADPAWSHSLAESRISNLGGLIGAYLSDIFFYLFGASAWWLLVWLLITLLANLRQLRLSKLVTFSEELPNPMVVWIRALGFVVFHCGSMGLEALRFNHFGDWVPQGSGGVIGQGLSNLMHTGLGFTGATLLFLVMLGAGFSLTFGVSWLQVADRLGLIIENLAARFFALIKRVSKVCFFKSVAQKNTSAVFESVLTQQQHDSDLSRYASVNPSSNVSGHVSNSAVNNSSSNVSARVFDKLVKPFTKENIKENTEQKLHIEPAVSRLAPSPRVEQEKQQVLFKEISDSSLPLLNLLDEAPTVVETVSAETLEFTSRLIEKKLSDFGVQVKVIAALPGPVITRYEIEPAPGVKGAQIVNLARDLARALSLVSIRVVETISGKNLMGLELPNVRRQTVRLTEILGSATYNNSSSLLTLALGKDISGKAVVADLAKMPHCLVAGTTGSGKSVGINAMILSLLYKADAKDVRLILIDPKMLEMSVYEGISHLLCPVVTDMRQAGNALNWCVGEMERRYCLMSKLGVRNLAGYNQKISEAQKRGEDIPNPFSLTPDAPEPLIRLPHLVIVIDELADLMMVVGKKIEELIARLAQKARAAGIHLILATQRPSVDVITGLIKANIPTRIAFQVSSKIDSRTILDQMGAEALLGQGDMLFLPPGSGFPQRVHGAFVSDDEVHRVVEHIKQQGEPNYIEGILEGGTADDGNGGDTVAGSFDGEKDALYDEAVGIVLKNRRASISFVQRHLRIGYNRAARLLESMEAAGLVSSMQSNGNREILVNTEVGKE